MDDIFTVLTVIAVLITVGVLFTGIVSFAIGGEFSRKHSNKLMRMRVVAQGIAVLMFAAAMFLAG